MNAQNVKPEHWKELCDQITQSCRDSLANIKLVQVNSTNVVAHDLPLQRMKHDTQSDACNDLIVVAVGSPNEKPVEHIIIEPVSIRLKDSSQNGRYNHVEILAENGTTILELRPGLQASAVGRV